MSTGAIIAIVAVLLIILLGGGVYYFYFSGDNNASKSGSGWTPTTGSSGAGSSVGTGVSAAPTAIGRIGNMIRIRRESVGGLTGESKAINIDDVFITDALGTEITPLRVTMSSTYGTEYSGDKLIHGIAGLAHTGFGDAEYINIVLPKNEDIGAITVTNRTDCCKERIIGCVLEIIDSSGKIVYKCNFTTAKDKYYLGAPDWPTSV